MTTKTDGIPQDTPLIRALLRRERELEKHLNCVRDLLLKEGYQPGSPASNGALVQGPVGCERPIKKLEALRLALTHALRPLKLRELVAAMEAEGYVFQGKVKAHALHNYLYREKPDFLGKAAEGYVLNK